MAALYLTRLTVIAWQLGHVLLTSAGKERPEMRLNGCSIDAPFCRKTSSSTRSQAGKAGRGDIYATPRKITSICLLRSNEKDELADEPIGHGLRLLRSYKNKKQLRLCRILMTSR